MDGALVLLRMGGPDVDLPFQPASVVHDPETLLSRIRAALGATPCAVIGPGFANASVLAAEIRTLDPSVNVILLAEDDGPTAAKANWLPKTRQRDPASDNLDSMESLIGAMAHDIGTPMTAILGYAELIAKSAQDEKNQKRAKTIIGQVHRVSEMIQSLLALQQRDTPTNAPLELTKVLDLALDSCREKLEERSIRVERNYQCAPKSSGDSNRLQRVFVDLFMNAAHAMPQSGALRISVCMQNQSNALICVSDTGAETDVGERCHVFEPYALSLGKASGIALGLLLTKTIVDDHQGAIELRKLAGRETEVRITLPARDPGAE